MVLSRLWFLLFSIDLFCLWAEEKNKKKRKKKECLSRNEVEVVCQGLLKKNIL